MTVAYEGATPVWHRRGGGDPLPPFTTVHTISLFTLLTLHSRFILLPLLTLLNCLNRRKKCMYNCYATALRWNKSPIKCTACGDAEKFLLGWFPPGSTPPPPPGCTHPHASYPKLPGPLKQLTSQRQSTSLFSSGCHVMPSHYVCALRCVPSTNREEYI